MRLSIGKYGQFENSIDIMKHNIILSYNGGGKTKLCALLEEGFNGKLKDEFLVNGKEVEKTEYDVFYIKDTETIDVEKTLSSKSLLKNRILKSYIDIDDKMQDKINQTTKELSTTLREMLLNGISEANIEIDLDLNYADIISKFSSITYRGTVIDDLSLSTKREAYFDLVIDEIENSSKPCIMIIDEYDLGLGEAKKDRIINKLTSISKDKLIVFISSSSPIDYGFNKIYVSDTIRNSIIDYEYVHNKIATEQMCNKEDIIEYYSEREINAYITDNKLDEFFEQKFINVLI